jgi:hypothetical protein
MCKPFRFLTAGCLMMIVHKQDLDRPHPLPYHLLRGCESRAKARSWQGKVQLSEWRGQAEWPFFPGRAGHHQFGKFSTVNLPEFSGLPPFIITDRMSLRSARLSSHFEWSVNTVKDFTLGFGNRSSVTSLSGASHFSF